MEIQYKTFYVQKKCYFSITYTLLQYLLLFWISFYFYILVIFLIIFSNLVTTYFS